MENLDLNAKKSAVLSDEELLKVCGGEDIKEEVMISVKKPKCDSAKTDVD